MAMEVFRHWIRIWSGLGASNISHPERISRLISSILVDCFFPDCWFIPVSGILALGRGGIGMARCELESWSVVC